MILVFLPLFLNGTPRFVKLNAQCWEACQSYSQMLREMWDPCRDIALDGRLKGVCGLMHVQASKLAAHLAVSDWLDTEESTPLSLNSTGSVAK